MPKKEPKSQMDLVREYFLSRPNQDISHEESKKFLENEWLKITGKRFEDSDRAIRHLKDIGFLVKVRKGVYRYDPEFADSQTLHDFDSKTKKAIFERDDFKCQVCGLGPANGIELHADHIKPKSLGGLNTLENGQTLCSSHNFLKKHFSQLEMGKKMFIKIHQDLIASESNQENNLRSFVEEVLVSFDKHNIDTHIKYDYKNYS